MLDQGDFFTHFFDIAGDELKKKVIVIICKYLLQDVPSRPVSVTDKALAGHSHEISYFAWIEFDKVRA